jgi:hypothetical protein
MVEKFLVAARTKISISNGYFLEVNLNFSPQSQKQNSILIIFAWIFAGLFVISSIVLVFSFFPTRKLLNPDFYKSALEDVGIYERLPETIAQQLATNLSQGVTGPDSPVYLLLFTQQEWESILTGLINPAWLQTQTENVLDQFFEILLVSPDPLNTPITISIGELKNRLAGEEGVQAFNQILNAQPDCSFDQVMGLLQLGLGIVRTKSGSRNNPIRRGGLRTRPDFVLFASSHVARFNVWQPPRVESGRITRVYRGLTLYQYADRLESAGSYRLSPVSNRLCCQITQ